MSFGDAGQQDRLHFCRDAKAAQKVTGAWIVIWYTTQPRACGAGMKKPGATSLCGSDRVGPFQRLVPGKLFPPFVICDE